MPLINVNYLLANSASSLPVDNKISTLLPALHSLLLGHQYLLWSLQPYYYEHCNSFSARLDMLCKLAFTNAAQEDWRPDGLWLLLFLLLWTDFCTEKNETVTCNMRPVRCDLDLIWKQCNVPCSIILLMLNKWKNQHLFRITSGAKSPQNYGKNKGI